MPNIARLKLLREKLTTPQVNYFDITALGQTRAYDPDLQEWWLSSNSEDNCVRSLMYLYLQKHNLLDISDEDLMKLLKQNGLDTEYAIALFVAQDLDKEV